MGYTEKHEVCGCIPYEPDFDQFQVRLNGVNFRCRNCSRFVSSLKWEGGFVERKNHQRGKGTLMIMVDKNHCPCCGQKMSSHRKAKKKLVDSVLRQLGETVINPYNVAVMPDKIKFIEEKLATPIVH